MTEVKVPPDPTVAVAVAVVPIPVETVGQLLFSNIGEENLRFTVDPVYP